MYVTVFVCVNVLRHSDVMIKYSSQLHERIRQKTKLLKETLARAHRIREEERERSFFLAWPLKLHSLIESDLLLKISEFYQDGIKPTMSIDTVEINITESFEFQTKGGSRNTGRYNLHRGKEKNIRKETKFVQL